MNLPWNDSKLLQFDSKLLQYDTKLLQYDSKLLRYFNPRNNGFFTAVIYHGKIRRYFLTLAPGVLAQEILKGEVSLYC